MPYLRRFDRTPMHHVGADGLSVEDTAEEYTFTDDFEVLEDLEAPSGDTHQCECASKAERRRAMLTDLMIQYSTLNKCK